MRLDWGIYLGCLTGAYDKVHTIGDLSKFNFIEIFLICVYAVWGTVIYGLIGAAFQASLNHFKEKWNGKIKAQKQFTLGL